MIRDHWLQIRICSTRLDSLSLSLLIFILSILNIYWFRYERERVERKNPNLIFIIVRRLWKVQLFFHKSHFLPSCLADRQREHIQLIYLGTDSIIFAFQHRWSITRLTSIVDDKIEINIGMHMSSYHPYYVIISLINTYHPINRFSISIQVWEGWQLWVLTNLSPNCLHIANGPHCVSFFFLLSCVSCLIGIHTTWNTHTHNCTISFTNGKQIGSVTIESAP